ncbi:hypothetical protein [Planktothricoides raciborskii]|uniref:hypothetical protein n=1 Tax=Planktothricoides raciborskii TaxID=132608 RepID=UPI0006C5A3E5|nr:hypothetical protein [Planktothricoides raciborskii]KOR34696.1 hypothetical protein AM228_22630 [Planktothricoides sp. SR001]
MKRHELIGAAFPVLGARRLSTKYIPPPGSTGDPYRQKTGFRPDFSRILAPSDQFIRGKITLNLQPLGKF